MEQLLHCNYKHVSVLKVVDLPCVCLVSFCFQTILCVLYWLSPWQGAAMPCPRLTQPFCCFQQMTWLSNEIKNWHRRRCKNIYKSSFNADCSSMQWLRLHAMAVQLQEAFWPTCMARSIKHQVLPNETPDRNADIRSRETHKVMWELEWMEIDGALCLCHRDAHL